MKKRIRNKQPRRKPVSRPPIIPTEDEIEEARRIVEYWRENPDAAEEARALWMGAELAAWVREREHGG